MHNKGKILVIFAILFTLVMSCGCINNSSKQQPISTQIPAPTTPTAPTAGQLLRSGVIASIEGKYDTALDYFNKSITADPNYAPPRYEKGKVLAKLNRTEEAISAYDSALALENNIKEIWESRGEALMTLGRYTEALESFDRALKIDPDYSQAKENRNLTLSKLK